MQPQLLDETDKAVFLTASALSGLAGIGHAFFTRRGGVSTGIFASLNCGLGSSDDPQAVTENRQRALHMAGWQDATLLTLYQIHSAQAITVTEPFAPEDRPKADAMITDRPGIVLGVLAADCVPVLFADPEAKIIGAAHAGWRGALGGVLEATIAAMNGLGARTDRIAAAIGPCIGPKSYEVSANFPAPFLEQDPRHIRFFAAQSNGKVLFDLPGYVTARLRKVGIGQLSCLGQDTYSQAERFFSYRRSCHTNEPDYGRMLSGIMLK